MTTKRVLFVGDASHHEFQEPIAWLGEYCTLTIVESCDKATVELANDGRPPDVIVLAAARPGIFEQHQVVSLLRRAPLARIIGLMGGWCEGELRTGYPWARCDASLLAPVCAASGGRVGLSAHTRATSNAAPTPNGKRTT